MIIGTHTEHIKDIPDLEDLIIAVGIIDGGAVHPGHNRRKLGKDPATIAQVAGYNEFGTESKDGKVIMPARPFMRNSLASKEAQGKIADTYKGFVPNLNDGSMSTETAGELLGVFAVGEVQDEMNRLGVVDTGTTKQHISYERVK